MKEFWVLFYVLIFFFGFATPSFYLLPPATVPWLNMDDPATLTADVSKEQFATANVSISSLSGVTFEIAFSCGTSADGIIFFYGNSDNYFYVSNSFGNVEAVVHQTSTSIDESRSLQFSFNNYQFIYATVSIGPNSVIVGGRSPIFSSMNTPTTISVSLDLSLFTNSKFYIAGFPNTDVVVPSIGEKYMGLALKQVRIWDKQLTLDEIDIYSSSYFTGLVEGMLHFWKIESQSSVIQDEGPLDSNLVFSGTPDWFFNARQSTSTGDIYGTFRRIFSLVPFSTFRTVVTLATNDPTSDPSSYRIRVSAVPEAGTLCPTDESPCSSPITQPGAPGSNQFPPTSVSAGGGNVVGFELAYEFGREDCGTIQSLNVVGNKGVQPLLNQVNVTFYNALYFDLLASNVVGSYNAPTSGGQINIQFNIDIGVNGPLASHESVMLYPGNGNTYECSNAAVNGRTLSCTVPPGVGNEGNIELTLCRKDLIVPNSFSFQAPSIGSISFITLEDENALMLISGSNFGRSSDNQEVTFKGETCQIQTVNDTAITCSFNPVIADDRETVAIEVVVGGQTATRNYQFVKCTAPCLNEGVCDGINSCDCSNTGHFGQRCESELVCEPRCRNEGVCFYDAAANRTACSCTEGFTGIDCNEKVSDGSNSDDGPPTEIIAGAVAGAGVIIIALVIVVIVLAVRKPKRQISANFVPLEKKDFTKIIYGDQLNAHPEKKVGNLDDLEELLLKDDMELIFEIGRITQITEADKISKALVIVFQDHDRVVPLLKTHITNEVKNTENAGNLFRSNSMVSKMFKFYSRLIGLPYLYVTIGPEVDKLIFDELGLEVDPEKMEEGSDLDEMRWTLMAQSQKILVQILNSVDKCPPQFRVLFSHIKEAVAAKFPNNIYTTIGGFIFLRFFCPAVSSPEAYGIVEEPPSPASRRLLILITKVLQNLSNDVEFGAKEPYMTKMNDFIQANRVKLRNFYDKLIKPPSKPPLSVDLPKGIKNVNLSVIAKHLQTNLEKIENRELRKKVEDIVGKEN